MVKLVKGDLDALARTVWAEARGQPFNGQCAVVHVILHRLNREPGRFPRTLQGIIHQPYAFSCYNSNDPQCARVAVVNESDPAFVEAMRAVTAVLTGQVPDNVNGSDHYHAATMKRPPSWAKSMHLQARIGDHLFYRERAIE